MQELAGQKSSGQIKPHTLLSQHKTNKQLHIECTWLGAIVPLDSLSVTVCRRTGHWTISSYGNYLSFCKATLKPRAVIVDTESRDSPILGPNSSAAQTQPKSLVLIYSRSKKLKRKKEQSLNLTSCNYLHLQFTWGTLMIHRLTIKFLRVYKMRAHVSTEIVGHCLAGKYKNHKLF